MRLRRLRSLNPVLVASLIGQLAITVVVLLAAAAGAQEEGSQAEKQARPGKKPPRVVMQVAVGQGNAAQEGMLTPVRVALQNNGDPMVGRLEVKDRHGNLTDTSVELPRRSNKVYSLYLPLRPYDFSSEIGTITLFEGRKSIAVQPLEPTFSRDRQIILSVSGDNSSIQFLHEANRLEIVPQAPADLPRQWAGYEPTDVVALTGRAWSQMDDEQKRALRIWVEQGGRAILSAESVLEWRDAEGQALAGVLPQRLGADPILTSTARWGNGEPCRATVGTILTVTGPLTPGSRELFAEDGQPLIVMRDALAGKVLWLGFNPFSEVVRNWSGGEAFWRRAIDRAYSSRVVPLRDSLAAVPDAVTAARSLPRLPAPPLSAVVVFGLSYAIIFGPVNIAVLRRLRRTVRAWLFVPALALGMTLVVLFAGQSWGNARTVLNSLSVLHAAAGGRTAQEQTVTGIFSPTNRAFDLTIDDPSPGIHDLGSASEEDPFPEVELGWPNHQLEGSMTWNQVALQLFATRVLEHSRPRDLGGSFNIDLNPDGSGQVYNGTSLTVQSAYLTRNGRYFWLGDLPFGTAKGVTAKGWTKQFAGKLNVPRSVGQMRENQLFRESVARLWRGARDSLLAAPARKEAWLVGEVADFRGGLQVADVPFNNRAALVLVRVQSTLPPIKDVR